MTKAMGDLGKGTHALSETLSKTLARFDMLYNLANTSVLVLAIRTGYFSVA